jgi:uncharacterized protein
VNRMTYRFVLLAALCAAAVAMPARAQTPIIKAPLRNPPLTMESNKTHLIFSGVTSNFPRIAVWLFQGMYQTLPRGTFRGDVLFIGDGAVVGTKRVCDGQAHFTVTTPAAVATMFYKGVGVADKPCPTLRGLFKIPQRDPITLAVRADLGVTSFEDIIKKKIPLKMATVPDSSRAIGFLYPELLKAYGTSIEEVKSWGGGVVGADLGGQAIAKVLSGEANALIQEGDVPVAPNWKTLNDKYPMRVLSISPQVMEKLQKFGFMKADFILPKGKYPGVVEDVSTIDYSDWIVLADSSVPDEIAYDMARAGVERKAAFESQYPDMAPMHSDILGQYQADPKDMWKNLGVPLHPGAAKYFKEKGLMP